MGGHHHDGDVGVLGGDLRQELHPVDLGHPEIGHDHVDELLLEGGQRLGAALHRRARQARLAKEGDGDLPDGGIVVHDEDRRGEGAVTPAR